MMTICRLHIKKTTALQALWRTRNLTDQSMKANNLSTLIDLHSNNKNKLKITKKNLITRRSSQINPITVPHKNL